MGSERVGHNWVTELNWTELSCGVGSLSHEVYRRLWIASLDVFTLKVKLSTGSPEDWGCESNFWGRLVYRDQATQLFFFLNSEYPDQCNKEQVVDTAWSEQLHVLTPHMPFFPQICLSPKNSKENRSVSWARACVGTGTKFWKPESSLCGETNQSEGVSCVFFAFVLIFPSFGYRLTHPCGWPHGSLKVNQIFSQNNGGVRINPIQSP